MSKIKTPRGCVTLGMVACGWLTLYREHTQSLTGPAGGMAHPSPLHHPHPQPHTPPSPPHTASQSHQQNTDHLQTGGPPETWADADPEAVEDMYGQGYRSLMGCFSVSKTAILDAPSHEEDSHKWGEFNTSRATLEASLLIRPWPIAMATCWVSISVHHTASSANMCQFALYTQVVNTFSLHLTCKSSQSQEAGMGMRHKQLVFWM